MIVDAKLASIVYSYDRSCSVIIDIVDTTSRHRRHNHPRGGAKGDRGGEREERKNRRRELMPGHRLRPPWPLSSSRGIIRLDGRTGGSSNPQVDHDLAITRAMACSLTPPRRPDIHTVVNRLPPDLTSPARLRERGPLPRKTVPG